MANKCDVCRKEIPKGQPVYGMDGKAFCESCYYEYKEWKRKQEK